MLHAILTEMSQEIAVSQVFTSLPEPRADSDTQLHEIWLHGRSRHTQRAYRADVEHFLTWARKPFPLPSPGGGLQFQAVVQGYVQDQC